MSLTAVCDMPPPTGKRGAIPGRDAQCRARWRSHPPTIFHLKRTDKAIAAFSVAYADQTKRDYEALMKAACKKRIDVQIERI